MSPLDDGQLFYHRPSGLAHDSIPGERWCVLQERAQQSLLYLLSRTPYGFICGSSMELGTDASWDRSKIRRRFFALSEGESATVGIIVNFGLEFGGRHQVRDRPSTSSSGI